MPYWLLKPPGFGIGIRDSRAKAELRKGSVSGERVFAATKVRPPDVRSTYSTVGVGSQLVWPMRRRGDSEVGPGR